MKTPTKDTPPSGFGFDGRSPDLRVGAIPGLPGPSLDQWRDWGRSPLTVAGAVAALGLSPHRIPFSFRRAASHPWKTIGATLRRATGPVNLKQPSPDQDHGERKAASMLRVSRLKKTYSSSEGPVMVLDDISLDVAPGQTVALTGESGSGKSTLLHLIGGLDRPDSGEIWLNDTDITALGDGARALVRRSQIGLVFQQFNLVPSLTVIQNIALQARLSGRYDPALTGRLIEALGLSDLIGRYPEQLSGGQQQRVAIGRTLANAPRLILADEPTGNLDETTGDAVMDLMMSLVKEAGAALIMATHSTRLAARFDKRLHLRRGRLEAG